jgi:hypothetical protein
MLVRSGIFLSGKFINAKLEMLSPKVSPIDLSMGIV